MAKKAPPSRDPSISEVKKEASLSWENQRLDAMHGLGDKQSMAMQKDIASYENQIRGFIKDEAVKAKAQDLDETELGKVLSYYYKEISDLYYQTNSNDTELLRRAIKPALQTLDKDIGKNPGMTDELNAPFGHIFAIAYRNIDRKMTFAGRLSSKAKSILGSEGIAGIATAAVTGSPLLGLAVAAYKKATAGKEGPKQFEIWRDRHAKELERQKVRLAPPTPTAPAEEVAPPDNTPIQIGGKYFPRNAEGEADFESYPKGFDDASTAAAMSSLSKEGNGGPTTSRVGGGAGMGGSGLGGGGGAIEAILNKHTGLLGGIYSNTDAIENLLKRQGDLSSLDAEELSMEDGAVPKGGSGKTAKTPMDFLSMVKDKVGKLMWAAAELGPSLLVAAKAAAVGFAGWAGTAIGEWIDNKLGIAKAAGNAAGKYVEDHDNAYKVEDILPSGLAKSGSTTERSAKYLESLKWKKKMEAGGGPLGPGARRAEAPAPSTAPVAPAPSPPSATPTPAPTEQPSAPTSAPTNNIAAKFILAKEGPFLRKATVDGTAGKLSIGYGHQIQPHEIAQGFIDLGDEQLPLMDPLNTTTITKPQAEKLFALDLPKYEERAMRGIGKKAWDKLNVNQKAALTSYAYNVGNTSNIKGLTNAILSGDTEKASTLISQGTTSSDPVLRAGLEKRRANEASLYKTAIAGDSTADGRASITADVGKSGAGAAPPIVIATTTNNSQVGIGGGGGPRNAERITAPTNPDPILHGLI